MIKVKSKPFFFLTAGLLWTSLLQAQKDVYSSGADASGIGGTVAFTLGQVFYTTNSNASGIAYQGLQQAYEIFTTRINETGLNISLSVFPNPTSDNLSVQISDYKNEELLYKLYDMHGKLLISGQINPQQTIVNTFSLPPAVYFIHIHKLESKSGYIFKIIKN